MFDRLFDFSLVVVAVVVNVVGVVNIYTGNRETIKRMMLIKTISFQTVRNISRSAFVWRRFSSK